MTRVLLVEDEHSFADPLAFLLRKEGFTAAVATTGQSALEEFDRKLIARIRAVLRRGGEGGPEIEGGGGVLEAGPVRMDVDRHVVSVGGADVALPLKEFDLLEYLLRNVGRVLTRGQLIDRVWGADYVGDTKTLDVHVKRLRSKVEVDPSAPRHLITVRGLGYKFDA